MKGITAFSILAVACTFVSGVPALCQERPPAWAYPVNPPDFKPPPDDGTLRRVPKSDLALTLTLGPGMWATCTERRYSL